MAERRMVSKVISLSEKVNSLSLFGRLLYTWMIPHADDFGRLPGSPAKVKVMVVPFCEESIKDVERELAEMHHVGIILWYETDGEKVVQITNFEEHQQGLHKRTKSKFPAPPERPEPPKPPVDEGSKHHEEEAKKGAEDTSFEEIPGSSGNVPGNSEKFPLNRTELNRTEWNGTEAEGNARANEITQTVMDVHAKVFGTLMMSGLMSEYVRNLLKRGCSEDMVIELMLETGETATKPNLRYMQTTAERWITDGIKKREQARQAKTPPPEHPPFKPETQRSGGTAVPSVEETRARLAEIDELRRRKRERMQQQQRDGPPGGMTHGT